MNILNLATSDENAAGVACKNINEMLLQAGHNSVLVVKESGSKNPNVIALQKTPRNNIYRTYKEKIYPNLKILYELIYSPYTDEKYYLYNLNETKRHFNGSRILKNITFNPDVILIYWVSGFINSKAIKQLADITGAKIFLIMTDNAPMTGGCHYPWDCVGFHSDCSNCPAILKASKKGVPSINLAFKKKYLPANVELISGSESDYQRAQKASLFEGRKIHKLLAPIDENRFTPGDKVSAKKHFGISPTQKVIFFGATSLNDPRKGVKYFLDALCILNEKLINQGNIGGKIDFIILLAGRNGFEHFRNISIPCKEAGYLNEEDLIRAYQAADFAVSPSVEDSGPMMVNQCIMCGTPMVTFKTGVAIDLVITGETGYNAKLGDAEDLAEGMKYLLMLNEEDSKEMSVNCRRVALNKFTPAIYAQKLTSLF